MYLYSAHLAGWASPADVFVQFYAHEENSFWLDRETHKSEPFSVVGAGVPVDFERDALAELSSVAHMHDFQGVAAGEANQSLPFSWRPGLVGVLDYEGGLSQGFIRVDRAIVFDHIGKSMYFVGLFASETDFKAWHSAALLRLTLVGGQQAMYRNQHSANQQTVAVALRHEPSAYLEMISQAQRHIAAGDVYQICLTNQIEIKTKADALYTFLMLREQNPAPYSAYVRVGKVAVVCASPEQFLQISAAGDLSTKPIKGTRPRGANLQEDTQIAAELAENVKERAENLMIVDLMRNDLSRVAEVETVRVTKLFEVQTYATVHQLVSTVEARLHPNSNLSDAMVSVFPGGSMTGAPKQRAMEIISELERGQRGIYSGVLGYVGVDGSADFGMTIRTLVFEGNKATIGVGGGITIDSDPDAELEETKLKAKALLAAINAPNPWE